MYYELLYIMIIMNIISYKTMKTTLINIYNNYKHATSLCKKIKIFKSRVTNLFC